MTLSRGFICFLRQLAYQRKERWIFLADEQPVSREAFDSCHRAKDIGIGRHRTNDRAYRHLPADERAWLGHDQIGLEVLPAGGYIERETAIGHIIRRRKRVARLVVPGLEVGGLGRADAKQD